MHLVRFIIRIYHDARSSERLTIHCLFLQFGVSVTTVTVTMLVSFMGR